MSTILIQFLTGLASQRLGSLKKAEIATVINTLFDTIQQEPAGDDRVQPTLIWSR